MKKKNIFEYKIKKFKTSDGYIVLRKDVAGYWIDYINYDIDEDDSGTRHTLRPVPTLKEAMEQVKDVMKGKI